MKLRSKFILPITGLVIVSAIVAVISINGSLKSLISSQQETLAESAHKNLSTQAKVRQNAIYASIDQVGKAALGQAALFSEVPEIQDVYEVALSGNINDENDIMMQQARQKLRIVMGAYIDGLKKQAGAKDFRIHFHVPSSRSLSRLWRSNWQAMRNGQKVDISDDLSSFRKTVVQINQGDHKPISGIEVGRGGFAIRGLSAVKGFDGEHVGSVEVLGSFNQVLKVNHTDDSYQIAVYMLADMLPIATRLQDAAKNPVLDGKYVFVSSTNKDITNGIITSSLLDAGLSGHSEQVVSNQFITSFPISDFSGKTVGVMALVYDMTETNALIGSIEKSGNSTINAMGWRFSIGAVLLVVIICGTIFYVTRRVIGPLQLAVGVAQRISLGDLSQSVNYQSEDEVGELAGAINKMTESLKAKAEEAKQIAQGNLQVQVSVASEHDTMGQAFKTMVENLNEVLGEVARASDQINSGSQQVSDTAQSLSQGATESAASLEEISSSMNEIGSQTQQSAENASLASQLADSAQSAARTGSERMSTMVTAMNEINEAGQNINKIIKVIDEIAFQTNLLALNAAVEAARAGQHGKGFAVVAEEVRNLAARSAKAAEETAQLIEGSVEKANNGTQIAEKTSEALNEIVDSITKATDLVAEIAAASNEQAQGISQINQGLGQIDQGVQQSTATAEESAAAAEELSSQSSYLKQMISRFKLATDTSSFPAAPIAAPQSAAQGIGWDSLQSPSAKADIKLDDDDFGKY
ncbi:Methyl-accepting chemotaxis protein [Malonomonas rubra DSM 5091]|uniref:Methyl-accepting chemotaxis protein n=1 Tax=Malonomonas rubra DSM 5091 TaxID=1122189 RepID=A0A1M6LYP6_MALRU|nr:methyl-accepting chemotaxis protein [Malonomonas rubra]SHJ76316.1 Methyl-accepting chemotaxis protein [Malonomonas rubra DSM 5091]